MVIEYYIKFSFVRMYQILNVLLITIFCVEAIAGFSRSNFILKKTQESNGDIGEVFNLLQSLYTELLTYKEDTEKELASLKETLSQYQEEINNLKEQLAPKDAIGFTATMVHGHHHLIDYSLVPFSIIIGNFGNHYNPATSQFKCPVPGMYYFSISLHSGPLDVDDYATTVADIVVDGRLVANAFCGNLGRADIYLQCSTSVIVFCPADGLVWVRSRGRSNQFAGDSEKLSNFAGFFIQDSQE